MKLIVFLQTFLGLFLVAIAQSVNSDEEITISLPLRQVLIAIGVVVFVALLIAGCAIIVLGCYCKSRRKSK